MKIYRNLWAGNPTWFVETSRNRDTRHGMIMASTKHGVYFQREAAFYNCSIRDDPEGFPLVGKVTEEELLEFIKSKCKETDKDASQSAQAKDGSISRCQSNKKRRY